ncbi:hypothetical protein Caci_7391 [Catenulispora acidiphila DSM 44928]|uniref:Uncharacterized protein n=1 Tax=Catenulispora acidiphila (strain DSM 44928 / JCM 14897 / NBRC 102108 / NRRL B-24433 / ID139908) TaxID=479433 RepID=C7Q9P8_CATAD|nr:hypothetical protein Caci_7391 [Catenulispora acidiphila DSM 44928]
MIAAFRYELRRLGSLRATRRVPGGAAVVAAAFGVAAALAVSAGASERAVALLRLAGTLPALVAAVVLGAAASGHERHYEMRYVTLAVVPRRAWLAVAKVTLTAFVSALTGALVALAAALGYALALAWAFAGDRTLIPDGAAADPILQGVAPAAAAATAAGLFGLAVGWLTAWYRASVAVAVAVVALAVPLAAGRLMSGLPAIAKALTDAEDSLRTTPVLSSLLNPRVLTAWPPLKSGMHPIPPTSLAATALLAAVALLGIVVGAMRWQRGN